MSQNTVETGQAPALVFAEVDYRISPHEAEGVQLADQRLRELLSNVGFNLDALQNNATELLRHPEHASEARELLGNLQTLAGLTYGQWQKSLFLDEDADTARAAATIFNSATRTGRRLATDPDLGQPEVLDHIDEMEHAFAQVIAGELESGSDDTQALAQAMHRAAASHTHERAWFHTQIPSLEKQPYGRRLIRRFTTDGTPYPVYVVQSHFMPDSAGGNMLWHTHGINRALAKPLGPVTHENMQLGIDTQDVFTSKPEPAQEYRDDSVVAIPPRTAHRILRPDFGGQAIDLENLSQDPEEIRGLAEQIQFTDNTCLHVYAPSVPVIRELEAQGIDLEPFVSDLDMLVIRPDEKRLYASGGGAWRARLLEDVCCGRCFVETATESDISEQDALKYYVDASQHGIDVYPQAEAVAV